MSSDDWNLFSYCIRAYRSGRLSRDNFCKMWRCAQQVTGFSEYLELLKGAENDQ